MPSPHGCHVPTISGQSRPLAASFDLQKGTLATRANLRIFYAIGTAL